MEILKTMPYEKQVFLWLPKTVNGKIRWLTKIKEQGEYHLVSDENALTHVQKKVMSLSD